MLKTPSGYYISKTEYLAPDADQIVVIASATGVVQQFYKHFATYLQENNISVISFDYGGIGGSRPLSLRKFDTSAQKWANNDLETVIQYAREKYSDKKLTLIGHSIGGPLIGLTPSAVEAENIVFIAAPSGYYKFWPFGERMKMLFMWRFIFPLFNKLLGYIPAKKLNVMEDLPGGMAMEWRKWCLSPEYLFEHIPENELYFDKIKAPIYSFSTDNDKFATVISTDWITNKYSNAPSERIHLTPADYGVKKIGHFGYFQKRCSQKVWPELLSKIKLI